MNSKRRRLGLRARATLGFGLTGLAVALSLAGVTYFLSKSYLLDQRETAAIRQAYANARLARAMLDTSAADIAEFLDSMGGDTASDIVLRHRSEEFATSVTLGPGAVPDDLARVVAGDGAGHQRFRSPAGELHLAVGVALPAADAAYFEMFPLDELEETLSLIARFLAVGVLAAAAVSAAVGRFAAGQLVRPLRPVTAAAVGIADGALDTRLEHTDDPDLRGLTDAFNTMAAALETRVEREARFAADVSHELRSPLAAVSSALQIIERRRAQLPPEVIEAFTVLTEKVERFQNMVLDLLEISKIDAGSVAMSPESIDLRVFLTGLLDQHGVSREVLHVDEAVPAGLTADPRRLAQALGNIVDNASRYAGGVTRVAVESDPGAVRIVIDDGGRGVDPAEREAIFDRFSRGRAGLEAGGSSGSGLGLALVAEHIRLHGGWVGVDDAPGGGARFVVELPAVEA